MSKFLTVTLPLVGATTAVIVKLVTENERSVEKLRVLGTKHNSLKADYTASVKQTFIYNLLRKRTQEINSTLSEENEELRHTVNTLKEELEKVKAELLAANEKPTPKPRAPRTPKTPAAASAASETSEVKVKAAPKPRAPRKKTTPATEPAATAAVEAQAE